MRGLRWLESELETSRDGKEGRDPRHSVMQFMQSLGYVAILAT